MKMLFLKYPEDNLNPYVNWLLVTAEDGSTALPADFTPMYLLIEKHWRKLRPEEKEKIPPKKKESMEERIIRKIAGRKENEETEF